MFVHPTDKVPEKVAVIGCGPSMQDYVNIKSGVQANDFSVDEVWGVNAAGRAIKTDLNFMMDDYHVIKRHGTGVFEDIKTPIITSVPRLEGHLAFPLAEVLAIPGARDYLNHTAAYIIAYAILIGVKELCIFGCDYIGAAKAYSHAPEHANLPYRYMACMAFWCGIAAARGINVIVTPSSPLLDADTSEYNKFYGYIVPPVVHREDQKNG